MSSALHALASLAISNKDTNATGLLTRLNPFVPSSDDGSTRAGMTGFTALYAAFVLQQVTTHIAEIVSPELVLLGDSSAFDIAIVSGDVNPRLPNHTKPGERRARLRAISQQPIPPRIINGVVKRCVSVPGQRVTPDLTLEEQKADFVLWRVMHPLGVSERQFVPMDVWKELQPTTCTCMGNLAILVAWPDGTRRAPKGGKRVLRRTLMHGDRKKDGDVPPMFHRGDPCCPLHSMGRGQSVALMWHLRHWSSSRIPSRLIMANDPDVMGRYTSFLNLDAGDNIRDGDTEETIRLHGAMKMLLPLHPRMPRRVDDLIVTPMLREDLENILPTLLRIEHAKAREQVLILNAVMIGENVWRAAVQSPSFPGEARR